MAAGMAPAIQKGLSSARRFASGPWLLVALLLPSLSLAQRVLRYSDHEPLGGMSTRFIKDVLFAAIEPESNGRLKIDDRWDSSVATGYDALRVPGEGKVADLAVVVPEYSARELPLHPLFKGFLTGPSGDRQVGFFQRAYAEIPALPAELQKNQVVEIFLATGYPVAFFSSQPLTTLNDLKGRSWRSASFWHFDFLRNAGATPVTMPWGEGVFKAMRDRTLEGLMVNVDSGYMLKVHEVAPHVRINRQLLACGANIKDMNVIRRHLSRIKGGLLAAACGPARLVTLAISDVPGDDPSVIGSGPTVPCSSSPGEALELLKRYGISVPETALEVLERLARAHDTHARPRALNHSVSLIATPWKSLQAAAEIAHQAGFNAHVLSDSIEGESREVAKVHAEIARAVAHDKSSLKKPCVILSGGETTVTVNPSVQNRGRGGRAGEFCLGLALALKGEHNIWALAADTDGIDGVEINAGALVTPDTVSRGELAGLSLQDHLDRHDSYGYFKTLNDLVITGPTHTNVNDFRAILVL